jgi:dihydropyrimidinase
MSVLIKGGRIVTAADEQLADVFVEGERVALIGESLDVEADRVVDATGKFVIPGAIDPHTHIEMPFGGLTTVDDFTSGTVAAAFGGTTTVIDFCLQVPGEPFAQSIETWHEKIERCKPVVDVGFHIAITDLKDGGRLEDLPAVVEGGVTSFKLFMAYPGVVMVDDETLFKTMNTARETGALVMVHAENGYAIDVLVREAVAEGRLEPKWHAATRPPLTEAEATSRAAYLAELAQAPLYVVHVSCREAVEPIAAGTSGARPAPSTCSSTRRTSSGRASRGRSTSSHRRRGRRSSRSTSGTHSPWTTSRSSRPIMRPSTGRRRRRAARMTSRRSRTARLASRTAC